MADEPGPDEVLYELDDWEPEVRSSLGRLLEGEGVDHRWKSAHLIVAEADADLVEELIDELDHPDALEAEDDDGVDGGAEVLSSLYVVADVLSRSPDNIQATGELVAAVQEVGEAPVPFGLDAPVWAELRRLADDLAGRLAQGAREEDVTAAARRLRDAVHPLV